MNRRQRGIVRSQRVVRSARVAVAAIVLLAVGSAALLGAGATALPTTASAAKKKNKAVPAAPVGFCASPIVDNYREPLEKLQRIPAIPAGGALPFAPAGMTLGATGPQGLLIGGSAVGFHLTNAALAGAAPPRLDWTVLERLIRLTDNGRRPHPAGLKRLNLGQLPAGKHRGLTFPLPATPAIYSLEITIQNHRGRLLGRYGEYIRIVDRTVSAGLTLAAYDKIVPGSYLESCFENHGTASIAPTGTSLERFDGTTWRPVAVGPQYEPAQSAIQRVLGPGEAERIATLVPPNARSGLYKLNATGLTDLGEPILLSAEFGVL